MLKNIYLNKILLLSIVLILLFIGIFLYKKRSIIINKNEVMSSTINISKKYLSLRYRTDNVLIEAEKYSFEQWNIEVDKIIKGFEEIEKEALVLEELANEYSEQKIANQIVKNTYAYSKQEISNIFDNAPAGKKIATLAKHLGVDAKKAFQILKNDQAQVEADAWNEAGDTFQKLETTATVIKDGCKVAGYVGGIAISGGTSAIMTGSTLAKTAIIVSGADLVLEVTDDGAKIALGNHNKLSSFVSDIRVVTEPIANILTIADLPNNLKNGYEKFNAVMLGLESFRAPAQEGKIIGINLPSYTPDKKINKVEVDIIEANEVEKWMNDNKIIKESKSVEEIEKVLGIMLNENAKEEKLLEEKNETSNESGVGVWVGVIQNTVGGSHEVQKTDWELTLREDGSAVLSSWDEALKWKKEGNQILLSSQDSDNGFYIFTLDNNSLTFVKIMVDGEEIFAGQDYMDGKAIEGTLTRK